MMAASKGTLSAASSGSFLTVNGWTEIHVQNAGTERRLPEGKTSIFWAIFLVVNAALGAGLLAFPLSFYMTGSILLGILIELFLIFFVVGGVLILIYSADVTQSPTYETAVEAVCGPVVKFFAELCLVAFCFGSNITYLVVIGDQLEDIMGAFAYHGHPLSHYWWANRKFLITAVAMLFIFPMLFFRRIGILSYTSFLSVLCCFYITIIITVRYFHSPGCDDEHQPQEPRSCSREVPDIIIAIPFICFGYQCHVSSIPVYTDMKNRSFKSFVAVIIPSVLICFCVYTLTGVFGYLHFSPFSPLQDQGACIASDILRNYCTTDIPVDVARGVLAVVIITSYPILTFCGRSALDSILMKIWNFFVKRMSSSSSSCRHNSMLHYSAPLNPSSEASAKHAHFNEGIRLRVESVVWFFISLLLALFVPVISYIISLTGGLAASFIFLFPGLILLRLVFRPGGVTCAVWQRVCFVMFACLIITLGTFIFGLSIVYTVMHDAKLID